MKRIFNYIILLVASATMILTGCKKEEIVFPHELPQFEIKDNAILLEVIVPTGTVASEQIAITGAFNGNKKYMLEKAENSDKKWGIYLFAEDFAEGMSLKDGFTFVSDKNGKAYTVKGEEANFTLDVDYGTRTNVWINRWESYYQSGDQPIEHDGYVVYVIDETGWDELAMYAWGDEEAFGGWPGIVPTGKETINGVEYIYFDLGASHNGMNLNLIFNNNGHDKQLADVNFTVERNLFLRLSSTGAEEFTPSDKPVFPTIAHDGQDIVFVADNAEWGEIALYMWGDINNLDRDGGEAAGWPGLAPDGTFTFAGMTWYYFLMGTANDGKNGNLIINNNGHDKQTADYNVTLGAGNEYCFVVNVDKSLTVIEDPYTYDFENQDPIVLDEATIDVYIYDATTEEWHNQDTLGPTGIALQDTVAALNVYAWGTSTIFGDWPGIMITEMEEVNLLNIKLYHYHIDCTTGDDFNFIFNNKNIEGCKVQYDGFKLVATEKNNTYYYKVTDTAATPLEIAALAPHRN